MPTEVMGVKRSGIASGFQNLWFGALIFSEIAENLKKCLEKTVIFCAVLGFS